MDEEHSYYSLRYIERNPVKAGMVLRAWHYPWSSAAAHIGQRDTSGLLDNRWWNDRYSSDEWRKILKEDLPGKIEKQLRKHFITGIPLGTVFQK